MKKIIRNIFLVFMTLVLSQCYTEVIEEVTQIPYDTIEEKLNALRELQKQINDTDVEAVDLQAKIDDLVTEINNYVPPLPPNIDPITYSIGVVSAVRETGVIGISGATVSIDIAGVRTTSTTDTDGQALFNDMRQGVVMVHIEAPGYTDVSFVADLINTTLSNVTSTIALYPTTAANGAVTIDGVLRYDPDRTDDNLSPVNPLVDYNTFAFTGYEPAFVINLTDGAFTSETQANVDATIQSWELLDVAVNVFGFVQPNTADFGYVPAANPGNIIIAIYEEMFVTATSNAADGTFQLVLPARSDVTGGGNNFRIHFEEFIGDETYVRVVDNITGPPASVSTSTRTRSVVYTALYGEFDPAGAFTGPLYPGTFIFPGPDYTFNQTLVNNFTGTIHTKGANTSLKADFFYAARARDE